MDHTRTRILVVEDEMIVSLELQQRLTSLGYEVAGATATGEQAILLATTTRPDLVLMDVRLSGAIDGVTAAAEIRSSCRTPVIFLTAYADDATVHRARQVEPFGYLLKPFQERELWSTIEMALYRDRAERALRLSERRYAATLDAIGDAVIATDTSGNVMLMNHVAEKLTGVPASQAVGRHLDALVQLRELGAGGRGGAPRAAGSSGSSDRIGDFFLAKKGGDDVRVSVRITAITNENGEPAGAVLVLEDVTRSRSLEEQLLQAQKMEAVGRLAGGVAHDFNNMLTIILSGSELLADELPAEAPTQEIVQEIREAAERCAALTRQLLIFSRKGVTQTALLDLNVEVEETKKMLRRLIGEDIRLSTVVEGNLPHVRLDPVHLQQLIVNLAVNARDAMPQGGVLAIETMGARLGVDDVANHPGMKPGLYVVLAVLDNGHGMDAKTLSHLFEPFFTTKEKGKGTGLGLATVYEIVRQSGGFITVDSEVGRGTQFRVYLPAVENAAKAKEQREGRGHAVYGSERVLLVEDEDTLRAMMCQTLQRSGYTVLEARNAGEALLICEQSQQPIQIMITDMVLPMMSGLQLAKRLRELHGELTVLFMSGYADELQKNSEEIGPAFLQKPFTADALTRKVRDLLDLRRPGATPSPTAPISESVSAPRRTGQD